MATRCQHHDSPDESLIARCASARRARPNRPDLRSVRGNLEIRRAAAGGGLPVGDVATELPPGLVLRLAVHASGTPAAGGRATSHPAIEYVMNYPELHARRSVRPVPRWSRKEQGQSHSSSSATRDRRKARSRSSSATHLILREIGRGSAECGLQVGAAIVGTPRGVESPATASAWPGTSQLERVPVRGATAGRLHHTNIVPVCGVGECNDVHYYASSSRVRALGNLSVNRCRGLYATLHGADRCQRSVGYPKTISTDDRPRTAILAQHLYGPVPTASLSATVRSRMPLTILVWSLRNG